MRSELYPGEEWRKIEGIESMHGHYEVSSYGRVRHVYRHHQPRMLSAYPKYPRKGSVYFIVHLGGKQRKVDHLVYEAFVGPIQPSICIVHRNMIKSDNRLENLMPVDKRQIADLYAGMNGNMDRRVLHVNRRGDILGVYRSARKAAEAYKYLNRQSVSDRCNGRIKNPWMPDGTTWIYEENTRGGQRKGLITLEDLMEGKYLE